MPKRKDIKKILVIGAGPIVIGQACEFDYSGTQACKVLKSEGYRVILVNSNPATIMTDRNIADATYLEPIELSALTKIIAKEKNIIISYKFDLNSPRSCKKRSSSISLISYSDGKTPCLYSCAAIQQNFSISSLEKRGYSLTFTNNFFIRDSG